MNQQLEDLERRITRIERIVWTTLGVILAKAGIEVTPFVSAFLS